MTSSFCLPNARFCACRASLLATAMLLVFGSVSSVATGQQFLFHLDPSLSVINVNASIHLVNAGITVPMQGQGNLGLAIPGFSDGTSGQFSGVLAADIHWDNGTISFGGGSLLGNNSGLWEPGAFGDTGIAPGFVGAYIETLLGLPAQAVAAVRDFRADYRTAYTTTPLTPSGSDQYSFVTNEWFAVSAVADVQGQGGIAALLGQARFPLRDAYAAQNLGEIGNLSQLSPDQWEVQIPVATSIFVNAGDTDIGPIYVSFDLTGQLVGRTSSAALPELILASISGNDSLATAQPLDGAFILGYNPDIGDSLVNTSAAFPHATVQALGDGTFDYYSFNVLEPGTIGIFDIDGASFDSELFLFDIAGNLLALNDDAPSIYGAAGSDSSLDAFLEYTFANPGQYIVAVGQYDSYATLDGLAGTAPPAGSQYTLHVSLSVVPEPAWGVWGAIPLAGILLLRAGRRRVRLIALLLCAGLLAGGPAIATANPLLKSSIEAIHDADSLRPMPYRLFLPPSLQSEEPVGELYPLVLFLHGSGERGADNFYQAANNIDGLIRATQGDQYSALLLAPQMTDFPGAGGWSSTSSFDRTIEILQSVVSQYPVDPNRIYLTGFSMGAFGTFHYMAAYPDLFAAAVPLAGGGTTSTAEIIRDVPLWAFHGALDATVSVNQTRAMIDALTTAGGNPLYTEIPDGTHGIATSVYMDAELGQYGWYDWMFSQSKAPAAGPLPVPEPSTLLMTLIAIGCGALAAIRRRNGVKR